MAIEKDLPDQLLAGRDPKDVFNKDGLVDELKKALSERILNAEIDEHLDGDGGEAKGNHRNGYSKNETRLSGRSDSQNRSPDGEHWVGPSPALGCQGSRGIGSCFSSRQLADALIELSWAIVAGDEPGVAGRGRGSGGDNAVRRCAAVGATRGIGSGGTNPPSRPSARSGAAINRKKN